MPKVSSNSATLAQRVRKSVKKLQKPLWDGPCGEGPNGGVTQSLLGKYFPCRERFRARVIDGVAPVDQFKPAMEYGNLWHVCEESFAISGNPIVDNPNGTPWERALLNYGKELCERYPFQKTEVDWWYNVCKTQFPYYIEHWKKHPDMKDRTPLLQEQVFDVPYKLPSGRVVRLRGKFDSVDIVGKGKNAAIWLQENKTKSELDAEGISKQLQFDLQTMMYMIALEDAQTVIDFEKQEIAEILKKTRLVGVRYNVIRRPLAGGKHSIKQKQNQSKTEFFEELGGRIKDNPLDFFMRHNVEISQQDIETFKQTCFDPVLENLCDDYEWWEFCNREHIGVWDFETRSQKFPNHQNRHVRLPYGIYNVVSEAGSDVVDDYITSGDMTGLRRALTMFPELC